MLKILVVDDEQDSCLSVCQVLREEGHAVDAASDGEAALRSLGASHFDLVVTDVRLPRVDGMTLLRHVRNRWPKTEVLVVTAYASIGDAVDALKNSAVDYLMKPFKLDALLALVERVEAQHRA